MEGSFLLGRRRSGRPPGRAPTRGFLEARAGATRDPVGAHRRARAAAPTRARRVPSSLSPPAAVRDPVAAELTAQLWAVSREAAPPPRQGQRHNRAHQRIIAAPDISADTLWPRGGAGIPDPRRAQCPSPAASGSSVPTTPLPARSGPESPRVGRARRGRGTLARTPPPGRRQRLTCPSGQSGCPGRRPPAAPDPSAGKSSGRPHSLPRAVSFGSTGVWGRRGRPRPPRPPSSELLGVAGGGGLRLGALSPPPRAPPLFYDHCERAVAAQPRRRAAAAWRAPRCLALLQHRKGNQVKLCRNSAPAPAWPRVCPQQPAGAQRTQAPPPARRPRGDAGPQAAAAAAAGAASSSPPAQLSTLAPCTPPALPLAQHPCWLGPAPPSRDGTDSRKPCLCPSSCSAFSGALWVLGTDPRLSQHMWKARDPSTRV
ncbi:PREDICTED: basic proline-rich protein-like [Hipposideros armiger]|uniref:Basic proline-rich protein-like n=1 Tax=Hipposideros armiger TaxID=186990 RepID=A0A8B7RAR6_HIPAR|nr:PREDICTED: basic proline-rich protein-like [Hipposideros armiger]